MSAQTVFSALDYLNRWTRARAHSLAVKTQLLSSKSRAGASVSGIYIDSITVLVIMTNFVSFAPWLCLFSTFLSMQILYLEGITDEHKAVETFLEKIPQVKTSTNTQQLLLKSFISLSGMIRFE